MCRVTPATAPNIAPKSCATRAHAFRVDARLGQECRSTGARRSLDDLVDAIGQIRLGLAALATISALLPHRIASSGHHAAAGERDSFVEKLGAVGRRRVAEPVHVKDGGVVRSGFGRA